jgi:hypothetical protein
MPNMRTLLRWMGSKLGMVTWYHISATYPLPNGHATMSLTCSVRPWLHVENYPELVAYVATQAHVAGAKPNIICITRLGP